MTEDGYPYGPQRYRAISKELYIISKYTNTSYEDAKRITPLERGYMIEFISEDMERQKQAYDKAVEKSKNS